MPFVDRGGKVKTMNYRNAVGPADKYDVIGALQFNVMVDQGLREHHTLLDIGCGSLRGGRLFIVYLLPRRYYGIEPYEHLVVDGINMEIGSSIYEVKYPQFHYSGNFDLTHFGVAFDYILAQSVFTHAAPQMIKKCLTEAKRCLKPKGRFIATYFKGGTDYSGTEWAQCPDARYTQGWMKTTVQEHGFVYRELPYKHPSEQTWFRIMNK